MIEELEAISKRTGIIFSLTLHPTGKWVANASYKESTTKTTFNSEDFDALVRRLIYYFSEYPDKKVDNEKS